MFAKLEDDDKRNREFGLNQLKKQEDIKISERAVKVQEANRKEENIEDCLLGFEQCAIRLGLPEEFWLMHLVAGMKRQDSMVFKRLQKRQQYRVYKVKLLAYFRVTNEIYRKMVPPVEARTD